MCTCGFYSGRRSGFNIGKAKHNKNRFFAKSRGSESRSSSSKTNYWRGRCFCNGDFQKTKERRGAEIFPTKIENRPNVPFRKRMSRGTGLAKKFFPDEQPKNDQHFPFWKLMLSVDFCLVWGAKLKLFYFNFKIQGDDTILLTRLFLYIFLLFLLFKHIFGLHTEHKVPRGALLHPRYKHLAWISSANTRENKSKWYR